MIKWRYRYIAVCTLATVWLTGCSSSSNESASAPITSVEQGGIVTSEPAPATPSPVSAPVEPVNQVVPSYPSNTNKNANRSVSASNQAEIGQSMHQPQSQPQQQPREPAPVIKDGKVVYNRSYQNIPKGSYSGPTYTVQRGDTLFYIAWITGNDFRDLAAKNNVKAPYSLNVGQVLKVGESNNASAGGVVASNNAPESRSHAIQSHNEPVAAPPLEQSRPATEQPKPTITYSEETVSSSSSGKLLPAAGAAAVASSSASSSNHSNTSTSASAPVTPPPSAPPKAVTSSSNTKGGWRWPTEGKVIENFSAAEGGNKGIDISGSRGQPVVAASSGRVVYAGNALRGYGNLIIIKHNDDYLSAYAHNDTMLVQEQQEVAAGQKIATMGSSGSSSVRLHFEIRYKGKSVNPLQYLPQQ